MSNSDLSDWMQFLSESSERTRLDMKARITKFKQEAGKPHAKITLGDDPEYQDHIGFWRVSGGIIRIKAKHNGSFDPADCTNITILELEALIKVYNQVPIGG